MTQSNRPIPDPNGVAPKKPPAWSEDTSTLLQGRHWSSALIWISTSLLFGITLWASIARIDQTITVKGRLQPSGSVKDIESPTTGVISKVFVKDGDLVEEGDPLFSVDSVGLSTRKNSLVQTLKLYDILSSNFSSILNNQGNITNLSPLPPLPPTSDPSLSSQYLAAQQQAQLLRSQLAQINNRLVSKTKSLQLQTRIANDLESLFDAGGISRNQYLEQRNRVQESTADVQNLKEETARILGGAAEQLTQINARRLSLASEIAAITQDLSYRTVKSPISGRIFDLSVGPTSVVGTDQVALKVVPTNKLEAVIEISNQDIGFVRNGLPVNVSVDSFPSGEFGYIKGTLFNIGYDSRQSPTSSARTFPASVSLEQQTVVSGKEKLNLQSGMSVSANIKLRSRAVISLITDLFTKQLEGVREFR